MKLLDYIYGNFLNTFQRRSLNKYLPIYLKKYINSGNVLDIGALNSPYKKYLIFDDYKILDIEARAGVDYVEDIHKTTLKENSFDNIIMTEVFEHLYDPYLASKSIHKILKSNGCVVGSVPFIYNIHGNPHDYFRYTKYSLLKIFSNFDDVEIIPYGNRFFTILDLIGTSNIFFRLCIQFFKFIPTFTTKNSNSPQGYIFILKK
jgi:SAM-dependent methyltransferase